MSKSLKRRGGAIAFSALVGALIGSFFGAPIIGAVISLGLTAGALLLLSRMRFGPM